MHRKNNLIKCFLICLAIVSLTSCTSTRLISAWEPNTMDQFAPGKILVTGMSDDMEKRVMFENAMAEALKQKDMVAITSISLIPDLKNMNNDSVIAEAKNQGIDFVMMTRIVEIGVKDVYVPDYNPILTGYYSDNRNNYGEIHKYQRTVCMKQQHVILRSEIFNSKTGELIWSGISDTIKPDSQLTAQEALLSITSTISGELMMVSSHSS